jgi:pimeloyl-ACP methyl ester carboxylesterase
LIQLVFIHGAGCTGEVFAAQLAAFPHAIALTLPGHTTPGSPDTIDAFADFVAQELERRNLDDVVLCGHSMGGAIALEVALRQNPRVAGLVPIGSGAKMRVGPAIFEGIDKDFEAAARTIAGLFFAEPTTERLEASVAMMLRVGKAQTERDFRACDAFDVTGRLAGLALPLLALTGERDVMMPPKFAQYLADRVPGAEARILSGAGHLAMIERAGDTNDALRAFVTQIDR